MSRKLRTDVPKTQLSQFATQTHWLKGNLDFQEKELYSTVANIHENNFSSCSSEDPAVQDSFIAVYVVLELLGVEEEIDVLWRIAILRF